MYNIQVVKYKTKPVLPEIPRMQTSVRPGHPLDRTELRFYMFSENKKNKQKKKKNEIYQT